MVISEENKTLENVYTVSVSEQDRNHILKPSILLNYMQNLAAKSIDLLGSQFSCDGLAKENRGWFLIRYRLEFEDYPIGVKQLLLKTENRGCQRLAAYRDFEGYDFDSGKLLFRATSSWFIVDLVNKSVVNIKQEYPEFFDYEKREGDLTLKKLNSFDTPDVEKVFHVRYDDLDINGHVNNTVYITWAMEALEYNFRASHKLKTMDIYFKHEVRYGEDIVSCIKTDNEQKTTQHLIKNAKTGEEVCLMKCVFVDI